MNHILRQFFAAEERAGKNTPSCVFAPIDIVVGHRSDGNHCAARDLVGSSWGYDARQRLTEFRSCGRGRKKLGAARQRRSQRRAPSFLHTNDTAVRQWIAEKPLRRAEAEAERRRQRQLFIATMGREGKA
jgi:hypothetical protein